MIYFKLINTFKRNLGDHYVYELISYEIKDRIDEEKNSSTKYTNYINHTNQLRYNNYRRLLASTKDTKKIRMDSTRKIRRQNSIHKLIVAQTEKSAANTVRQHIKSNTSNYTTE